MLISFMVRRVLACKFQLLLTMSRQVVSLVLFHFCKDLIYLQIILCYLLPVIRCYYRFFWRLICNLGFLWYQISNGFMLTLSGLYLKSSIEFSFDSTDLLRVFATYLGYIGLNPNFSHVYFSTLGK